MVGGPHPFANVHSISSMWSVNSCPNTSLSGSGFVRFSVSLQSCIRRSSNWKESSSETCVTASNSLDGIKGVLRIIIRYLMIVYNSQAVVRAMNVYTVVRHICANLDGGSFIWISVALLKFTKD